MTVLKRTLLTLAALAALALGLLGLVIPIIPGVLFVALALVLFAGASRRFRNTLHASPRVRPYLIRWEAAAHLPFTTRLRLGGWLLYAAVTDSLSKTR